MSNLGKIWDGNCPILVTTALVSGRLNTQEKTIKANTFFRDLWLADFGTLKYTSDTARCTFFQFFVTSLPKLGSGLLLFVGIFQGNFSPPPFRYENKLKSISHGQSCNQEWMHDLRFQSWKLPIYNTIARTGSLFAACCLDKAKTCCSFLRS